MATYPYEVGFPVKFNSGGDTTKEAFGKHIQEIERIYGILNGLNADKISASEFTTKLNAHINNSNPHPNLDLGNTKGSIPFSRVSGDLDLSRTTGNLNGSRITGTLSNAYIDKSKVNGLESFVKSLIPESADVESNISGDTGVVKIGGLIMQWGKDSSSIAGPHYTDFITPNYKCTFNFKQAFPNRTLFFYNLNPFLSYQTNADRDLDTPRIIASEISGQLLYDIPDNDDYEYDPADGQLSRINKDSVVYVNCVTTRRRKLANGYGASELYYPIMKLEYFAIGY